MMHPHETTSARSHIIIRRTFRGQPVLTPAEARKKRWPPKQEATP